MVTLLQTTGEKLKNKIIIYLQAYLIIYNSIYCSSFIISRILSIRNEYFIIVVLLTPHIYFTPRLLFYKKIFDFFSTFIYKYIFLRISNPGAFNKNSFKIEFFFMIPFCILYLIFIFRYIWHLFLLFLFFFPL